MGYILGLDLGITSVGFGIIEEDTYKIIKFEGCCNNVKQRPAVSAFTFFMTKERADKR